MSKFDFSPEALDEGLTRDEEKEFTRKLQQFQRDVDKMEESGENARTVADTYQSWLALGESLLTLVVKTVGQDAARREPPGMRNRFIDSFNNRISTVIADFMRQRS